MIKEILEKYNNEARGFNGEKFKIGIAHHQFDKITSDIDMYMDKEMIAFGEWLVDDINPFVRMEDGRWMQACGNSTSWTTQQLLQKFKESR